LQEEKKSDGTDQGVDLTKLASSPNAAHTSSETSLPRNEEASVTWQEVSQDEEVESYPSATDATGANDQDDEDHNNSSDGGISLVEQPLDSEGDTSTPTCEPASSEDEWSDAMMTPITPHGGASVEDGGWQVL
jgi:hypothetical protein